MVEREHCPNCGSALPVSGPQGHCPACLLQQARDVDDPDTPMREEQSPTTVKNEVTPSQSPVEGHGRSDANRARAPTGPESVTRSYELRAFDLGPDATLSYSLARVARGCSFRPAVTEMAAAARTGYPYARPLGSCEVHAMRMDGRAHWNRSPEDDLGLGEVHDERNHGGRSRPRRRLSERTVSAPHPPSFARPGFGDV
jgi:hypothetical protein